MTVKYDSGYYVWKPAIFLLCLGYFGCVSSAINYLQELLELFGLFPWLWI